MDQCSRCDNNEVALTDNFCKVCGLDLKAAAGTTATDQKTPIMININIAPHEGAAESLEKFVQKLQEPETKELYYEILNNAISTAINSYNKQMINKKVPINPRAESRIQE
ncbi:hypothetical protein [Paenibacillus xylanilyticus]|uniref:Uncharacterized protein n=1 Tax=Paenibacillus xylanilyticus TaxID=248903 RepID=A0A7Y6EU44_9BACL|nr:hypothetical protein [Paenibacillus xylanilyticus]NUU74005.1 hypothetical protein [Paenibacillus xylanilyticus]